jgi:protein-ribulosamine 3-kinase
VIALPPAVLAGVEGTLRAMGLEGRVGTATPASGGCINHGARLDTSEGGPFFLKWNASAPVAMFEAEAHGLRALREAGTVRVPEPLATGGGSGSPAWLLLEHVAPGRPAADHDERLGRGLAALHRSADAASGFGWPHANWIGSLPQSNRVDTSWSAFWREQRVEPQLRLAADDHRLSGRARATIERAADAIPAALRDVDQGPPHLLHGDLWGGNAYADAGGAPVLIDPAAYRGHGEVDLAMSELFGGFGARVYRAYGEVVPITDAYGAYRRDLYQLYYLLVHVNLFGGSYVGSTVAAASRVAAALAG